MASHSWMMTTKNVIYVWTRLTPYPKNCYCLLFSLLRLLLLLLLSLAFLRGSRSTPLNYYCCCYCNCCHCITRFGEDSAQFRNIISVLNCLCCLLQEKRNKYACNYLITIQKPRPTAPVQLFRYAICEKTNKNVNVLLQMIVCNSRHKKIKITVTKWNILCDK